MLLKVIVFMKLWMWLGVVGICNIEGVYNKYVNVWLLLLIVINYDCFFLFFIKKINIVSYNGIV